MNEDDTFNRLRRPSFEEMLLIWKNWLQANYGKWELEDVERVLAEYGWTSKELSEYNRKMTMVSKL